MLPRHLYNVATIGMTWASNDRPKTMTKSKNVLSIQLTNAITNSMSNNKAARCQNVAGVNKKQGV